MKNLHSPNLVGIGSRGPEIWPHECLISPIEICVNWPGSKQLWTRPFYTAFNLANYVIKWSYLRPWTDSCKIWCVKVFHHVLLNMVMEVLKCRNEKKLMRRSHYGTLWDGLDWPSLKVWKKMNINTIYQCQYQYTNTNTNIPIPIPIPIPILISILISESIKSDCNRSILVSSVLSAH